MRVGCIGYGTIGQRVVLGLAAPPVAVLVRRPRGERDINFVYSVDELVSADPEVVIEAASPDALAQYALPIVSSGRTLIAASGAGLRNDALRSRLIEEGRRTGGSVVLAAGALAGLDALAAAAVGGLERVRLQITDPNPEQPPFDGSGWDGVRRYPARLNVAAAAALAAGRDIELTVRNGPRHELRLEASGDFGELSATLRLAPEQDHIVALSLLETLQRLAGPGHLVIHRQTGSAPG